MARILIVEDDAHVLRLMSMWLTKGGHEVLEASNGKDAMEICADGGVELVVSDINMPHADGIQLVRWMRERAKLDVPVIMLSARCDQVQLGELLSTLDVKLHPKPFSPSRLNAEIERRLAASKMH